MAGQRVRRRLAALLAADVVGYCRLIGEDEEGILASLNLEGHPSSGSRFGKVAVDFTPDRIAMSLKAHEQAAMERCSRAYWRLANELHIVVTRFGESLDLTTLRADCVPDPLTNCINQVSGSGTSLAWLIPFTAEREVCKSGHCGGRRREDVK